MYKFFTSTQLAKQSNPQPTTSFSPLCLLANSRAAALWHLFPHMVFAVPGATGMTSTRSISHSQAHMTDLLREICSIVANTPTSFPYHTCWWRKVCSCNCLQVCSITRSQRKLLPLDSLLFINTLLAPLSNSHSWIYIHWEWLYLVVIASCIWLSSTHVLPEQFTGQMSSPFSNTGLLW